jgi:protein-S-isoprenylcysteine O-methyltransferase Ste14
MWVLLRASTYATLFIGLVLVLLPAQILEWAGVRSLPGFGMWQVIGIIVTAAGAALALWCVMAFAFVGKGTPAPFDPPRLLVVRGLYRYVRNPMYIGAGLALAGAALAYQSFALLGFTAAFWLVTHIFVLIYEEPTLRRMFGSEYDDYLARVHRWLPGGRCRTSGHSGE